MVMATFFYCQSHINTEVYRLDALGFHRAIVEANYSLYRKRLPPTTIFTGSHSLHQPANNLKFDCINLWISKGSQRQCSLPGCKGISIYCKKCNVSVHVECFELYHCK